MRAQSQLPSRKYRPNVILRNKMNTFTKRSQSVISRAIIDNLPQSHIPQVLPQAPQ